MAVIGLFVFCILLPLTGGHFNIFIGPAEVRKLLGLGTSKELYYVTDGVANTYALSFEVKVPQNVSELEFCWQSTVRHPPRYMFTVEYNRSAMKRPTFSIPVEGKLPLSLQTFIVKLECTGDITAEAKVLINLNVSGVSHRDNNTFLTFKRTKICLKTQPLQETTTTEMPVMKNVSVVEQNTTSDYTEIPINDTDRRFFYMCFGAFCGIIIVIIVIVLNSKRLNSYFGLNKWVVSRDSIQSNYTTAEYAPSTNVFVRLASTKDGNCSTISSIHKYSPNFVSPYATSYVASTSYFRNNNSEPEEHIYSNPETCSKISYYASFQLSDYSTQSTLQDPRLQDLNEKIQQISVPRNNIIMQRLVHEGTFGRVYRGLLRQPHNSDKLQNVIIKTVSEEASGQQIATFLAEGMMLFDLKHVNILTVIAANTDSFYSPFLVYSVTSKGNLKKYLQNCRIRDGQYTLHTQDIINMAIQVAVAGVFLHTNGLYHKDLAARNCMVDDGLRVKVTDSALSRDLFPNDYHCRGDNENRPIKWMAIETLILRQYTGASDVWSFAVLVWELLTLGQQPYEEIDPYQMELYLKDGYRLSQPVNCPDDLFGMMTCCWLANPEERPSFVQLLACLQDFQTALTRFI